MDIITIILLASCFITLSILIGMSIYTIHKDTLNNKRMFEIQMTSAKTNRLPDIYKMPYNELMKIVNETINYYTTQNMTLMSLVNKSSEEISLLMDDLSADIATKVKISVSPYVSECITCYITDDFYDRYIINSVRLLLVAHIEQNKNRHRKNNFRSNKPNNESTKNNNKKTPTN